MRDNAWRRIQGVRMDDGDYKRVSREPGITLTSYGRHPFGPMVIRSFRSGRRRDRYEQRSASSVEVKRIARRRRILNKPRASRSAESDSNRLEALRGDRAGLFSIRVNASGASVSRGGTETLTTSRCVDYHED